MSCMSAAGAAVKILELEGATQTFGLPGAAIKPSDPPTAIVLLY